jgi:hypothetical protein
MIESARGAASPEKQPTEDARTFLTTVFGGFQVAIWPKGAGAKLFTDHDAAAQLAVKHAERRDVYVHCAVLGGITGKGAEWHRRRDGHDALGRRGPG